MTTIVFDGFYLAADTRLTTTLGSFNKKGPRHCSECGEDINSVHMHVPKIILPKNEVIFEGGKLIATAGTGVASVCEFMTYLVETHPDPVKAIKSMPASLNESFSQLLVITEKKVLTISSSGNKKEFTKFPVAIGSGKLAALVAVKEGFTAMESICYAAGVDTSTNDTIDYLEIAPCDKFEIKRYVKPE